MEGVDRVRADQCQYGATSESGQPIKKPTRFLSNSVEIRNELQKKCTGRGGECSRDGAGKHILCSGRVARLAAIYPFELCRAILRGIYKQLEADKYAGRACGNANC